MNLIASIFRFLNGYRCLIILVFLAGISILTTNIDIIFFIDFIQIYIQLVKY